MNEAKSPALFLLLTHRVHATPPVSHNSLHFAMTFVFAEDFLFDTVPEGFTIFFRYTNGRTTFESFSHFIHIILFESSALFLFKQLFDILVRLVKSQFGNPALYESL